MGKKMIGGNDDIMDYIYYVIIYILPIIGLVMIVLYVTGVIKHSHDNTGGHTM